MQPIFFSNQYNILDSKFKEMMDKLEAVKEKTDDYELIKMSKHILAKDYYPEAISWLKRFKESGWYKDDLK